MNLTSHFTIEELTKTDLRQFDNTPPDAILPNLKKMADKLEDVRTLLGGRAIIVNSCFRSKKVNDAVGSKDTSSHREGLAADFICPSYGSVFDIIKKIDESLMIFDQLILEFYNPSTGSGWVHLGIGSKMRRQILTINSHGAFAGIHP